MPTATDGYYLIIFYQQGIMDMASRILFVDETNNQIGIKTNRPELNDVVTIKEEGPVDEVSSNSDSIQGKENQDYSETNSDRVNSIEPHNKDKQRENVIYLGSQKKTYENQIKQEGNIAQGEANIAQGEAKFAHDEASIAHDEASIAQREGNIAQGECNIAQSEGNVTIVLGAKDKRKNKTELEFLGMDMKNYEDEYDLFRDRSKRFRKSKLRKTEQPDSYEEPADYKRKRHISTDDETDLICPVCQQEYENKVALRNHIRIHNKTVQNYTCSLCSKKFEKNADLIAHRGQHNGESFLCQECKLAFSNYRDYRLHNYEHLSQPHFNCSECGLRYRKKFYKQHITTHFEKLLSCDLCSFVTNGEYNLRAHLNQHKYKLACVECGKESKCKKDYEYHMSIHTGVKRVQCLYCGACFRNQHARDVHTRIHTGEKPFTCDICGHKSRQWTDMQRHKESHGTEKKYACDLCGKKYLHKCYLMVHMRSHSKKTLYECPECDAKFVSVGGLKTHSLFKHTSERPVECTLCNKNFINNNQYQKHCRAKYHLRNLYGNKVDNKKNE